MIEFNCIIKIIYCSVLLILENVELVYVLCVDVEGICFFIFFFEKFKLIKFV